MTIQLSCKVIIQLSCNSLCMSGQNCVEKCHRAQAWHFHDKFSGRSEFTWRAGSRECARTDGRSSAISQDERLGGKRRVRPKHFRRQKHCKRPVRIVQAIAGATGNHTPRLTLPVVDLEAWLQLFAMAVS